MSASPPSSAVALYHAAPSYYSQQVRLALHEKGVAYESRPVDIGVELSHLEPWYVKLNPRAVVPTLVHGEGVVTNALRIVRYVDASFEGPPLGGDSEHVRTWTDRLDAVPMGKLSYGRNLLPGLPEVLRRKIARAEERAKENPDLRAIYDAKAREFRDTLATWQDPSAVRAYTEQATVLVNDLDDELAGAPFVSGDSYGLADTLATVFVARLELLGLSSLWADRANVADYYARMRARPSFDRASVTRIKRA